MDSLLGHGKCKSLPPYEDALSLAEAFSEFFYNQNSKDPDPRYSIRTFTVYQRDDMSTY